MKKIAILTCLKSNNNCTRASCLQAFYNKTGYFSKYKDEEIKLVALWTCQGCMDNRLYDEEGFKEKIQRIFAIGTDTVHIGVCCITRNDMIFCKEIKKICEILNENNIKIVFGTHN